MNNDLQSKVAEILGLILEGVQSAGDFAMSQLPEIAQQYVLYGRVVSAVWSLAMLAIAAPLLWTAWYAFKHPWNTSRWDMDQGRERSDSNYVAMFVGGSVGVLFFLFSIAAFDFLVWLAPKAWLIKEMAALVK